MTGSINTNINVQVQPNFGLTNPQPLMHRNDYYDNINKNLHDSLDSAFKNKLERASGSIASNFSEPSYREVTNNFQFNLNKPDPVVPQTSASMNSDFLWNDIVSEKKSLTDFIPKPLEFDTIIKTASYEKILGVQSGSLQTKLFDLQNGPELKSPKVEDYLLTSFAKKLEDVSSSIDSEFKLPSYIDTVNQLDSVNNFTPMLNLDFDKPEKKFDYFNLGDYRPNVDFDLLNKSGFDALNNLNSWKSVNNFSVNNYLFEKDEPLSKYKSVFDDLNKPKSVNDYSGLNYINDDYVLKNIGINFKPKLKMPDYTTNFLNNEDNNLSGFNPNLTIRDFPVSGVQLHMHEGPGGTAHWRSYDRKDKIPINGYDAAMADLMLPDYIKKILK
ncbi:hypothetical protein KO361_04955 [Candidatus Woesearchaeota archaeon]|nr:hypothetical protein [Candidatus Woesearchaeota archaeon]